MWARLNITSGSSGGIDWCNVTWNGKSEDPDSTYEVDWEAFVNRRRAGLIRIFMSKHTQRHSLYINSLNRDQWTGHELNAHGRRMERLYADDEWSARDGSDHAGTLAQVISRSSPECSLAIKENEKLEQRTMLMLWLAKKCEEDD